MLYSKQSNNIVTFLFLIFDFDYNEVWNDILSL